MLFLNNKFSGLFCINFGRGWGKLYWVREFCIFFFNIFCFDFGKCF